jgi:hypothetical protein
MIAISELMVDHQEFHSDLQMDSFITQRNGGTLYGLYKQALRELATRIRALRDRYFGIELLELEIAEHNKADTTKDRILARQKRSVVPDAMHTLQHTEREFVRFYGQCVAIREAMEAQGICFPLDPETRYKLDCEMWVHQLKCRAAISGYCGGRPDNITLELIQSLPPDMRKSVCEEVFSNDAPVRLLDWFLTYECPIPPAKALPEIEPRKLIGVDASQSEYQIGGWPEADKQPTDTWKCSA